MKNYLVWLFISLNAATGWTQTEEQRMEDMLLRMQQLLWEVQPGEDRALQLDTFFFYHPGEQNSPFGVLPPIVDDEALNEWRRQLEQSIEKMEKGSWLDFSEFFRSFGNIPPDPLEPDPENTPRPRPEEDTKPKKKRKIYRL